MTVNSGPSERSGRMCAFSRSLQPDIAARRAERLGFARNSDSVANQEAAASGTGSGSEMMAVAPPWSALEILSRPP